MAKSVNPDQMPHSAMSDLGLHCKQRPICPQYLGLLRFSFSIGHYLSLHNFVIFLKVFTFILVVSL